MMNRREMLLGLFTGVLPPRDQADTRGNLKVVVVKDTYTNGACPICDTANSIPAHPDVMFFGSSGEMVSCGKCSNTYFVRFVK